MSRPAANAIALVVAAIIVALVVWPWPLGERPFSPVHMLTTALAGLVVGVLFWLRARA